MSINMIETNSFDCKYVEIFTYRVGSEGAPSRTVIVGGTDTKQWEVPKIAGRDTKANISQKGSAKILIIIIQFNSLLYYLRAESTATRPITDIIIIRRIRIRRIPTSCFKRQSFWLVYEECRIRISARSQLYWRKYFVLLSESLQTNVRIVRYISLRISFLIY
jgi:hypothetical protein